MTPARLALRGLGAAWLTFALGAGGGSAATGCGKPVPEEAVDASALLADISRADLVVTTTGIQLGDQTVVPLDCTLVSGAPCGAADRAAVDECLGLHTCDGTRLGVPNGALDHPEGYAIPSLRALVTALPGADRPLRLALHPALPYRVVAAVIYTLALAGHEDLDIVDLDPRWFRDGILSYRPPRRTVDPARSLDAPSPVAPPTVTVTLSHLGSLDLSANRAAVTGATFPPVDDGVNVAALQRWLAALPPALTGANAELVIAASSDMRWATLARVVAVTRERLPDRGYAYLGALAGALAKRVAEPEPRPLLPRLVFAVARD